ncbi:MAG: phosphate ABC transporter substrate-binding protein [Actinomycetota bacterium]|nr:phosphate ABC transporter substrate-binding protein [Actinomycetota bacterium]
MSSRIRKFLVLPLAVLVVGGLLLAAGCGESTPSGGAELSGTIQEAGSTSVLPLAEELAKEFMKLHPKVRIETGGGGSGAGVTQCAAGTVDLGAASRDVKLDEADLIPYPIARDAVAIVVHSSNPLTGLKLEEVARIFAGEITDWNEIGGTAGKITVIAREEGSGTRDCFEEKVMGEERKMASTAILKTSNGEIQTAVSQDTLAIGFVSLGFVSGLKALDIEGVPCTVEKCQSGEYPVLRRLYLLTKDTPASPVKEFIDFARGDDGQKIAEEKGYVPLVR